MKSFYPILFFVVLSFNAFAQNWSPIVTGDEYHYELVGETTTYDSVSIYVNGGSVYFHNTNPVAATIWVDSTSTDASTGIATAHLNKIVKPNQTGYLQNQTQFLGGDMVISNDCEYSFIADNELLIKTCAIVGEMWIFENVAGISAEVVAITEGEIFGNTDSFKHIALSNGDTIILSKSHGIIQFPQLDNDTYYRLTGIQTRDLGVKIPGYREFYDFNVGDIFQYKIEAARQPLYSQGILKVRVTGKEVYPDSIVYELNEIYSETTYTTSYGMGSDEVYSSGSWQYDNTMKVTENHVTNFYPKQLFSANEYMPYNGNIYDTDWDDSDPNTKHTLYFGEKEGRATKLMHCASFQSYFLPQTNSDILANGCLFECHRVWEEGLGETAFLHIWFEGNSIRELTGYVIDGNTTGEITPDELLIGVADIDKNSQLTLSPNPASDILQFDIQTDKHLQNIQLTIYDAVGKTFIRQEMTGQQNGSINISNLPDGIYFISFQTSEGMISRKFVKN